MDPICHTRGRARLFALALGVVLLALSTATGPASAGPGPGDREGQGRIVGGTQAPPGAWPSQVALVQSGLPADLGQFCGGTIVSWSWVVTATHCTYDSDGFSRQPHEIDVLIGTQRLSSGGTRIAVVEIRRLPGWNPITFQNDLSVLRIDRPPASTTPFMPLIDQGRQVPAGTNATTVGWGDTVGEAAEDATYPDDLRQVTVPIVADSTCAANYPTAPDKFEVTSMICAGVPGGGKDSCQGDSGGPLMIPRAGGGWTQMGVVSWGIGCADPGRPGVYTRLSQFSSWSRSQIRFGPFSNASTFVDRQFLDLYGRPSTAQERAVHAGPNSPLATQQITPARWTYDRIQGRWQTTAGAVTRLYRAYFLRDPDTAGLAFWTSRLQRGGPLTTVSNNFASSAEFRDRYGSLSDSQFVDLVYQNVLGRPADPGGKAFWVGELRSGRRTRGQVMTGFSEGSEFKTEQKARVDVVITFFGLVRRVPNSTEIAGWEPNPNLDLITALLGSRQYAVRF